MNEDLTHEAGHADGADVPPTPVKRRRRWLRRAGVALLALLVILMGLRAYLHLDAARAVRQYRAAGHPMTWAEFVERYGPADGEPSTGADFFAALQMYVEPTPAQAPHVPQLGVGNLEWPAIGEPVPDEMRRAVTEFLAANAPMLAALEAAHRGGHLMRLDVYRDDPDTEDMLLLDGLGPLRRVAMMRDLAFQLAVREERVDDAINAIAATRRLADAAYVQPLLITELVGMAVSALSTGQSKALLGHVRLAPPQLETLGSLFAATAQPPGDVRMYEGETLFALGICNDIGKPSTSVIAWLVGLRPYLMRQHIEQMQQVMAVPQQPVYAWLTSLQALGQPRTLPQRVIEQVVPGLTWDASQYAGPAEQRAKMIALSHAIITAAAVERFERERGELPAALNDLVPEYLAAVPIDPFDGAPLRYQRLDDGYVIYSVGTNGTDDGGDVDKPWNDLGIRVQRADLRAER